MGFQRTDSEQGFEIMRVKGWDYPALIKHMNMHQE